MKIMISRDSECKKLVTKFLDDLNKAGVINLIVALTDPSSNADNVIFGGSAVWKNGIVRCLEDDIHIQRLVSNHARKLAIPEDIEMLETPNAEEDKPGE